MASVLLEARPYRPFKSSEEYLEAMKEDLAEWLGILYPNLMINADNFMERLDTGVALCKHANNVRQAAEDYLVRRQARNKSMTRSITSGIAGPILAMGTVHYLPAAKNGTFFARDNVSNFITWCRKSLKIFECLLFETDDLIMRKNEKHVILCLLEVARRGAKFGMLAPMLVQMERQIDREIAADNKANGIGCGTQTDDNNTNNKSTISTETELYESDSEDEDDNGPMLIYGPQPQIITNDLKSLDEMVRDLVEKCTCPSQFPMVRVSEGKYRIGDTKVLIFVRILRSHVMVRVGGGWDTLSHYLDKHDPCRCKLSHRSSVAARLIPRTNQQTNGIELHKAQVIYERSPPSARKVITSQQSPGHSTVNGHTSSLSPPAIGRGRSRSPTPQRKYLNQINSSENHNAQEKPYLHQPTSSLATNNSPSDLVRRSMSPNQKRFTDIRKKQTSLDAQPKSSGLINGSNVDVSSSPPPSAHISNHVQFDSLGINTNDTKLELSSSTQSASPSNGLLVTANTSAGNTEGSTKFENISDNGSEISDEGYRSLGVIQSNAQKRESLHSQTSVDDVDNNGRLDQNSSDSQLSPMENNKTAENLKSNNSSTELLDTITSSTPSPPQSKLTEVQEHFNRSASEESESNKFELSGIFITEDEITVDIASATGLRKTGFANRIYGGDEIPFTSLPVTLNDTNNTIGSCGQKKVLSKIPRSPVPIRRRSVDNTSDTTGDHQQRTGLPIFNRKQPVYRSVRTANDTTKMNPKKSAIKDVTNTWCGGRQNTNNNNNNNNNKKRPSITSDTFMSPSHSPSNFDRNTKNRSSSSSHILYDSNGRRVRGNSTSLTTSPVKSNSSNGSSSPLAQQLLEAASNAKNDAQILDKMKKLLSKYSMGSGGGGNGVNSKQRKADFDDFTTAWVHSNGNLERSSSCSPPTKAISKRNSSAASSNDSTHSRDMASLQCLPRNRMDHRGISKIPAPITRQNTELC